MKLSIIIPVYNNFKNLQKLLKSLEKQTVFSDAEIIIVDDGSKETEKLRNLEIKGIDLQKYFIQHQGASGARNFGYSKSTGEYIFFCDADVIFLKNNALEKMTNKLEQNPNKAYCYCSFKFGWKQFTCGEFDKDKLKNNNYISTMSMIKRKALEEIINNINKPWDKNLKRFQDWDLWLTMLEQNLEGIWIPELLWQAQSNGIISSWLPKISYKIFKQAKKIQEFEKARKVIQEKHNICHSDRQLGSLGVEESLK